MTDRLSDLTAAMAANDRARGVVEYARALSAEPRRPLAWLEERFGPTHPHVTRAKAAVGAMTTGDPAALSNVRTFFSAFLELTRRRTVLGRLAGTRPAPANVRVPIVSSGTVSAWVSASGAVPVTAPSLTLGVLPPTLLGTILPLTRELMRSLTPQASDLLQRDLARAIRTMEDATLLDAEAAVELERPAGLLFGRSPVGGGSPSAIQADIESLWGSVRDGDLEAPHFIASPRGGMYLAALTGPDGGRLFPNARPVDGGDLFGVPLLISPAVHANLILVDASSLTLVDEGLELDVSERAALQMTDAPSAGAANVVSGFQTGTTFLRVTRVLHWALGYEDGAGFLTLPLGSPA